MNAAIFIDQHHAIAVVEAVLNGSMQAPSIVAFLLLGLVVVGVAAGIVMSSRWAGERGWVYNRHNPRPPGAGIPGGAFGQIFKPETEHVVEEMRSEQDRADHDESGDDHT